MCQHISESVSSGCPRRLIFSHLLLSSFLIFRLSRGVEAWNADFFVCSRRLSRYRSVNMWKLAAFFALFSICQPTNCSPSDLQNCVFVIKHSDISTQFFRFEFKTCTKGTERKCEFGCLCRKCNYRKREEVKCWRHADVLDAKSGGQT